MADIYSITSKFKAQVDTTTGLINGKMYPDSKPDRNLAGGQGGSLGGEYDGTKSVSYTGVIDTTSLPSGSNYQAAAFRSSDLEQVGSHITGDVLFVSFQVISQIGSVGKLRIKVGNLSSGQDMRPLAVGESMTIPFNEVAIGDTGGCAAHAYSNGINETKIKVTMIGA